MQTCLHRIVNPTGGVVDIKLGAAAEEYRAHVRALLRKELPADWCGVGALDSDHRAAFDETWRAFLVEHSLIAPGWPSEYGGGGLDIVSQSVVGEEFVRAG